MTYKEAVATVKQQIPLALSYEEAWDILGHVNASLFKRRFTMKQLLNSPYCLTLRDWDPQNRWTYKDLDRLLDDEQEDERIRTACIEMLDMSEMERLL